jgi:hypothetical protein
MRSGFWLSTALILAVLPARAADTYRTYINARFGTVVEYPANLVFPRPESDNGDGRKFVSRDGAIEFTVYGSYNALDYTVTQEMQSAAADWKHDGSRITYQKAGPNWYAISGYSGDDIFYEKAIYRKDVFHTLIWQYPIKMKSRLDVPVNRSVHSLRVGQTGSSPEPTPKPRPKPKKQPQPQPVPGY